MAPTSTRWIGRAGAMLCAFLALGGASPHGEVSEGPQHLRPDSRILVLPPVQRDDLLPATEAAGDGRARTSISLDVTPPRPGRGWALTIRAMPPRGPTAQPPRAYWKLASEPPSAFRPLGVEEQLAKRSAQPTPDRITIDVVFGVDWRVLPGRYDVDLLFELEPL